MTLRIRPTGRDDLAGLHELFLCAIGGVYLPHAFEPPAPPLAVFAAQQGHLLKHGSSVVAESGGGPLGFASTWRRGGDWFLASLFVAPEAQGRGIGSALLDAVWDEGAVRRRTITDAIQPVSNALYARRGLIPVTPVLSFGGRRISHSAPRSAAGLTVADGDVGEVDAIAYGFSRAPDHALWSAAARRTVWCRDGEPGPAAYSYAFPGGAIGPVAGVDATAAAGALASELARADGDVRVRIPGSCGALVATALAAGLRLSDTPGLLLCSENAEPPSALAIGSYAMY